VPFEEKECGFCKKTFLASQKECKRNGGKFCSKDCVWAAKRGVLKKDRIPNSVCAFCNVSFFKDRVGSGKTGKVFCCRDHKDSAQKKTAAEKKQARSKPSAMSSYRALAFGSLEHKCASCGYCAFPDILQVHHKDMNHQNNALDNLAILCPRCHYLEHFISKTGSYWNLKDSSEQVHDSIIEEYDIQNKVEESRSLDSSRPHVVERACGYCARVFYPRKADVSRGLGKYCSKSCGWSANKGILKKERMPNADCAYCGESFWHKKPGNSKSGLNFCCADHKNKYQRLDNAVHNNLLHLPHYAKGARVYRDKALRNNINACKKCGYCETTEILHVHHVDRNRSNNSLENLEVLCPNCHEEEHFLTGTGRYSPSKNKKETSNPGLLP
jgi:5-methylcytosine-specific restriction endonuclease McrA